VTLAAASGYSGTPLPKKLGIKDGARVALIGAPKHYRELLVPLPAEVRFAGTPDAEIDLVQLFVTLRADLETRLAALRATLRDDAVLWVSWPKKASGVATDVTEDVIRAVALPLGFVDVKVCAVDATWSGLKLVVRKELRTQGPT
jgi:hypothetical protein